MPDYLPEKKRCPKCHRLLSQHNFNFDNRTKSGLRCWCKDCSNKQQREDNLQHKYGMTGFEYNLLLKEQNGVCAICGNPETSYNAIGGIRLLSIDHSHYTEKVRGLLCNSCNVALGRFKDDINILKKAIKYLEKNNEQT